MAELAARRKRVKRTVRIGLRCDRVRQRRPGRLAGCVRPSTCLGYVSDGSSRRRSGQRVKFDERATLVSKTEKVSISDP